MGTTEGKRLIISVDLDMWWHCRWASGSRNSRWKDVENLLRDHYGARSYTRDVEACTEKTLAVLEEHGVKATFFVLGEMASLFPGLVGRVHGEGHEIACHGWSHVDAGDLGRRAFRSQAGRAKKFLEDLIGDPVVGFRAPNLILTPWLLEEITREGFLYDSSICPSRKFLGKFGGQAGMPSNPFAVNAAPDLGDAGRIVEIPLPAVPLVRLPGSSGIMTRAAGYRWTWWALSGALKTGDAMYYFHPYELGERPRLHGEGLYVKVFLRNVGGNFEKMLRRILGQATARGHVLAGDAARDCFSESRRKTAGPGVPG